MAAVLVEGKKYALSSQPSPSSISGSRNKSVYHVKVTDAMAKALDEFRISKGKNKKQRMTIQFYDNQGRIVISGDHREQEFQFVTAVIKQEEALSSLECIEHTRNGLRDELHVVEEISKRLTVTATDEVYKSTKEKMTLVEQEIKKSGAKQIEMNDPDKGRKVKQRAVRPVSLQKTVARLPVVTPPHTISPVDTKLLVSQTASFSSRCAAPSPVAGNTATSIGVSNLPNGAARSSSSKPLSNPPAIINYPYRDRIIHLLALRPYTKLELDQILRRDGVREKDKNTLSSVLSQVATNKNNLYNLLRHVLNTEVRLSWPFFTDENRLALKRIMETQQEMASGNVCSTFSSPAVSPCLSNSSSSRGSPPISSTTKTTTHKANKRPVLLVDDGNYHEPPKKQRIAHSQKSSSSDRTSEQPLHNGPMAVSYVGGTMKTEKIEFVSTVSNASDDVQENLDQKPATQFDGFNYKKNYVTIVSKEQRKQYKDAFNSEYSEYLALYSELSDRMQVFKRLKEKLSKECGESKEKVREQIITEYRILQSDDKYLNRRSRCDYLHAKLGHIKCLVDCFDTGVSSTQKALM